MRGPGPELRDVDETVLARREGPWTSELQSDADGVARQCLEIGGCAATKPIVAVDQDQQPRKSLNREVSSLFLFSDEHPQQGGLTSNAQKATAA